MAAGVASYCTVTYPQSAPTHLSEPGQVVWDQTVREAVLNWVGLGSGGITAMCLVVKLRERA